MDPMMIFAIAALVLALGLTWKFWLPIFLLVFTFLAAVVAAIVGAIVLVLVWLYDKTIGRFKAYRRRVQFMKRYGK